jgi:hypothetical protein
MTLDLIAKIQGAGLSQKGMPAHTHAATSKVTAHIGGLLLDSREVCAFML